MKAPNKWVTISCTAAGVVGLLLTSAPAAHADNQIAATVEYVSPDFELGSAITDAGHRDGSTRACGNYITGAPIGAGYVESLPGCSFIGTTASTKYQYSWTQYMSDGTACVQGLGYSKNIGGTYVPGWSSVGCGTGGNALAPWGNVAAVSKVRTMAIGGPSGVKIMWS